LTPALTVADLTRAALGLVPTVADLTRAALGLVPTVADLTHAAQALVPIVADLIPAPTSRVLVVRVRGRVAVHLTVIMPPAAPSAVDPTFIAMAPKLHVGSRLFITTISMSLRLISRISTLAASSLNLTPRISTTPRRDLSHISSPMAGMVMRPRVISRIPTPITKRRTLTTKTLTLSTTKPTLKTTGSTLITRFPRLARRIRVLVGLHPPLGTAAARAPLMAKASASRRFCRVRVSRRVARRRIGFAPAASPSTANPPCSARGCRTLIKYA
jgi:hypothetical protein